MAIFSRNYGSERFFDLLESSSLNDIKVKGANMNDLMNQTKKINYFGYASFFYAIQVAISGSVFGILALFHVDIQHTPHITVYLPASFYAMYLTFKFFQYRHKKPLDNHVFKKMVIRTIWINSVLTIFVGSIFALTIMHLIIGFIFFVFLIWLAGNAVFIGIMYLSRQVVYVMNDAEERKKERKKNKLLSK